MGSHQDTIVSAKMTNLTRDAAKVSGLLVVFLLCVVESDPVVELGNEVHHHPMPATDMSGLKQQMLELQRQLKEEQARSSTAEKRLEKRLEAERAKSEHVTHRLDEERKH